MIGCFIFTKISIPVWDNQAHSNQPILIRLLQAALRITIFFPSLVEPVTHSTIAREGNVIYFRMSSGSPTN